MLEKFATGHWTSIHVSTTINQSLFDYSLLFSMFLYLFDLRCFCITYVLFLFWIFSLFSSVSKTYLLYVLVSIILVALTYIRIPHLYM